MTDTPRPDDDFDVTVTGEGPWSVVVPVGELDVIHASALEGVLHATFDAGADRIAVDLDGVSFLDSTALRVLVAARARAVAANVTFAVICGPGQLRKLLRITHVDDIITVVTDRAELRAA